MISQRHKRTLRLRFRCEICHYYFYARQRNQRVCYKESCHIIDRAIQAKKYRI